MTLSAIIVAAGSGKRMGNDIPKQFIKIKNRTILDYTIEQFIETKLFHEIIIVHAADYGKEIKDLMESYPQQNIISCIGGVERFHSVQNALNTVHKNCDIVYVHDAVRPFCSKHLIIKGFEACEKYGSAIPVVPLKDSIRLVHSDGSNQVMDRSLLRSVQTPQVFNFKNLFQAYQVSFSKDFTDDASVFERAGHTIHIIDGEATNTKITTPEDLEVAKIRLIKD